MALVCTVRHTFSESYSMERRWRRWGLGVLVLAMVHVVGCASTVNGLKQRGVEYDSGKVVKVYRF